MALVSDKKIIAFLNKQFSPERHRAFEEKIVASDKLRRRVDKLRSQLLVEDLAELEKMREFIYSDAPVVAAAPKRGGRQVLLLFALLGAIAASFLMIWNIGGEENIMPTTTKDPGQVVPEELKKDTLSTPVFVSDSNQVVPNSKEPTAPAVPIRKEQIVPKNPATKTEEPLVFADASLEFYLLPDEFKSETRGAADTSLLQKAITALVGRRADVALSTLRELKEVAPTTPRLDLYTAHAYFLNGDYALSAELFRAAAADAEEIERDELEWFLLLALLAKQNNVDTETQALVDKMVSDDSLHAYKSSALLLQKRIRQPR